MKRKGSTENPKKRKKKSRKIKAFKAVIIASQAISIVLALIFGCIGFCSIKDKAIEQICITQTSVQKASGEANDAVKEVVENAWGWNSLHKIFTMYFMNYSEYDTNGWLIAAKILAAYFAMGVIYIIAADFFKLIVYFWKGYVLKYTLVVGDNRYAQALLGRLGKRGIGNEWKGLKTRGKIVLMGTDEENLQYLQEHEWLKHRSEDAHVRIFMRSSKINGVLSQSGNIVFFSLEEIAARKYWKTYPLEKSSTNNVEESNTHNGEESSTHSEEKLNKDTFYKKKDVTISIIGEGELLEELLLFGTQTNIYGEDYHIHYLIFGDNQEFEKTHRHHDKLGFKFVQGKWWQDADRIDALRKSDRVIILDQKNPYQVFTNLLLVAPDIKEIHIFADEVFDDSEIKKSWDKTIKDDRGCEYQGALVLFNWIQECCCEDLISDNIIFDAIGCNEVYNVRNSVNYKWDKLSTYHKYSNIMASDFADMYKELIIQKPETGKKTLNMEYLPKFGELEHERWNNYNYYFNWDVSEKPPTTDAKYAKDIKRRLHAYLVPYSQLISDVKMKDINAVIWMLIQDEMPKDVTKLHDAIKAKLDSMPKLEEEIRTKLDSTEENSENA